MDQINPVPDAGMLLVYKEKNWTSFDVTAKLRRLLHTKRVGHTGTLDPEAEGVLVVVYGKATRLAELFSGQDKTYEAVARLGVVTDTQDMTGRILSGNTRTDLSAQRLPCIGQIQFRFFFSVGRGHHYRRHIGLCDLFLIPV